MGFGGQGMEPELAPSKVQVVYYLSRGGQLQQPHLIDVPVSPHSNGLYLRDVKQKLTSIRGKGVADSFSWSCKRNYKDNYIWQDLSDDDKLLPLSDGEFVLKGSGLYTGYQGKNDYQMTLEGQVLEPESTSLSPSHPPKVKMLDPQGRKFDFEAVKRNLDLQPDCLQDQSDLAAALTLSLQLMSNPYPQVKRLTKDKSMDLNKQVMSSLSQAKTGSAEERILDHYDVSSSETFRSEESAVQTDSQEITRERAKSITSSSCRTEQDYDRGKQADSKNRSISRDVSKVAKDVNKGRHEKPDDLPSIKTKVPNGTEQVETTPFIMLSPRRIMAALSTPEKKLGKMLHSSSTRSSTLSTTTSTQSEEPSSTMRLSKQAACLSQLRICSQLSHHATDSRPDSPVRQNSLSGQLQPSTSPQLPTPRCQSGPYWTRWKAGRKSQPADNKVITEEPATPTKGDSQQPEGKGTVDARRVLKTSFEFDRPTSFGAVGTSLLQTDNLSSFDGSLNPIFGPGKTMTGQNGIDTSDGAKTSSNIPSNMEGSTAISEKQVISQQFPIQAAPRDGLQTSSIDTPGKEAIESMPNGRANFSIDAASLPRVSISDAISAASETVRSVRPESPESPLNPNPPSSPVRTSSPIRTLSNPSNFNKRTEDGRARARGMVKEVGSKDSRFMKDAAKELERAKGSSVTIRSIASTKRIPATKNSTTVRPIPRSFSRSPPRISSILWEDPPKKDSTVVDRDQRPLTAGRSNLDWEKTLQEVASVSLPPPDFGKILQECGQCGRTFRPDSLKVHMRGCHTLRRSKEFHTFTGTTLATRARQ